MNASVVAHSLRPVGILDDDVERVREATDIVALVGEHVALKRVGRRFQGLCPFHTEKTPSFSVSPDWASGTASAARRAATRSRSCARSSNSTSSARSSGSPARANITLRYDDATFSEERKRKQRLHEAVQAAIDFYHARLLEAPDAGEARRYLRSRGFDGDVGAPVLARLLARRATTR